MYLESINLARKYWTALSSVVYREREEDGQENCLLQIQKTWTIFFSEKHLKRLKEKELINVISHEAHLLEGKTLCTAVEYLRI